MKKTLIQIWFQGDVGPATIEYTKSYKGSTSTAHNRFIKTALKTWPTAARVSAKEVA